MKLLQPIFLSDPYGLYNTGSICYFNSLLQILASCTSIYDITFNNSNAVENVFMKYVNMIKNNNVDPNISSELIMTLHATLPNFGNGQESASEAFVLLLDQINNRQLKELFMHRFRCTNICNTCKNITEEKKDHSVVLNLFHVTDLKATDILLQENKLSDYKCEKCKELGSVRTYRLTMLPEIIFCTFNVYNIKSKHLFPDILIFPGTTGPLKYKLIGQIEHAGSLNGGHYWSRSLRKNNVYLFNDYSYQLSKFEPTDNTYIILYHVY